MDRDASPQRKEIILAIVGYREFDDWNMFMGHVLCWIEEHGRPTKIISGGCKGTDKMAERFAEREKIPMIVLWPDNKNGRNKFAIRDREIANQCSHMIAFPSKRGKGTQLTIKFAHQDRKHVTVVNVP